jgi:hypothetical protein
MCWPVTKLPCLEVWYFPYGFASVTKTALVFGLMGKVYEIGEHISIGKLT